ncbi:MAG: pseudouridine synthase [Candidatus Dormiibacterota bacterium]
MTATRINRFLARRGVASRRGADLLVGAGRVRINGNTAGIGTSVDPERDRIEVDGELVEPVARAETVMLNKPSGVVTTVRDSHGRQTVMDLLVPSRAERGARGSSRSAAPATHGAPGMVPIGRLDSDSRGLLLISSDGDLAHRLTHPRYGVTKRYRLTLARPAAASDLRRMVEGVHLEDGPARALGARIHRGGDGWVVEVEMGEGRKHEVRRLAAAVGLEVVDLLRVSLGPLRLGDLAEGRWRRLTIEELHALRASVGMEEP